MNTPQTEDWKLCQTKSVLHPHSQKHSLQIQWYDADILYEMDLNTSCIMYQNNPWDCQCSSDGRVLTQQGQSPDLILRTSLKNVSLCTPIILICRSLRSSMLHSQFGGKRGVHEIVPLPMNKNKIMTNQTSTAKSIYHLTSGGHKYG